MPRHTQRAREALTRARSIQFHGTDSLCTACADDVDAGWHPGEDWDPDPLPETPEPARVRARATPTDPDAVRRGFYANARLTPQSQAALFPPDGAA